MTERRTNMKQLTFSVLIIVLAVSFFTACSPKTEVAAPAAPAMESAPVSDGSEDLVIDYMANVAGADQGNYFKWKGNVRYMAAEDSYDAASGASEAGSTHLFMMYLYDVEAKETMTSGLRGLFLYGINGAEAAQNDKLEAMKGSDGTITVQYVHRGTAFRFTTDSDGVLSLPDGSIESRKIGTPQEIESEFSSDGTAQGVDYATVWESGAAHAGPAADSMYFWDGDLQFGLDGDNLTIQGVLTAVAR